MIADVQKLMFARQISGVRIEGLISRCGIFIKGKYCCFYGGRLLSLELSVASLFQGIFILMKLRLHETRTMIIH